MTVNERVKLLLGNLHVALMEKEARIEELEARVKELEGLLRQHESPPTHMASP